MKDEKKVIESGNKIIGHYMDNDSYVDYSIDWNLLLEVWKKLSNEYFKKYKLDYIEHAILSVDLRRSWSLITGFINKHILTEEEYRRFKND